MDLDGRRIDAGPTINREGELRTEAVEYAGIMEWGIKARDAGRQVELTTGEWRRMSRAMAAAFGVPWDLVVGRTWPRWWCWLCGHTPTETASFEKDTWRCRCGVVTGFAGELRERRFRTWWLRLIGGRRRPWRHVWRSPSTSDHGCGKPWG